MQILKPLVHETIWGGDKLSPFSPAPSSSIGHLYSFIDNKIMNSEIEHGSAAGTSLHDWFLANRKKYRLENYEHLPILSALVEAKETLSIQVHPNDAAAKDSGLPFGKNESFFVLEAPEKGFMYNGCKANDKDEVIAALKNGSILEVVDKVECKEGDYIYIEGGTLHAATAGSLLFEVEENCDRTYRIYDFDRRGDNGQLRDLQTEKALMCLDLSKKSSVRQYREERIDERMYSTLLVQDDQYFINGEDMFAFAVMISGQTEIGGLSILPGRAILLEPGERLEVSDAHYIIVWPRDGAID